VETVFWQTIAQSRDAADFEEYLRRYPQGQFAGLARNRLAVLRTSPAVANALPSTLQSGSLAGRWSGTGSCGYGSGSIEIDVALGGPDRYTLSGSVDSVAISGWIQGKQVHFEYTKLFNHVVSEGSLTSPISMSGTLSGSVFGGPCQWSATKK
jgi:hypothetical protein